MPFFLETLVLGLVLSADSFSAAIAMGGRPFTFKEALSFAICSSGAETLATLAGFWAGANIISLISEVDHWIAFGILAAVALHMAIEGFKGLRETAVPSSGRKFHSFSKILLVSLATSMDAFGVGLSLGVANKPIIPYLGSIGFWAFGATLLGLYLAKKLSAKFGSAFTLVGALVLAVMSIQMLKI